MVREHRGGSELWAEAGRTSDPPEQVTSDPPEQVASGAEFPSPLPSLGDESFPFHILLRAPREATAASWGPFTCSLTFSPPGHQDLRILRSLSCLRSYISYNSTWMQTSGSSLSSYCLILPHSWFFSFHWHSSLPKTFPQCLQNFIFIGNKVL